MKIVNIAVACALMVGCGSDTSDTSTEIISSTVTYGLDGVEGECPDLSSCGVAIYIESSGSTGTAYLSTNSNKGVTVNSGSIVELIPYINNGSNQRDYSGRLIIDMVALDEAIYSGSPRYICISIDVTLGRVIGLYEGKRGQSSICEKANNINLLDSVTY